MATKEKLHTTCKKFSLDDTDLKNIRYIGEHIMGEIPKVLDRFYEEWMENQPYFKKFFPNKQVIQHIKEKQIDYWEAFFEGKTDEAYIQSRKKLGEIHAQVGLTIDHYFQAQGALQKFFQDVFHEKGLNDPDLLWSFMRYVNWDMSMVTENTATEKNNMLERMLTEQSHVLEEMSTPIANLWEGILLLPLFGRLNKKRAAKIMDTILEKIAAQQAKILIIDISGVPKVDVQVANYLVKITKACQLMGCKCTLSGISSNVAETLVELVVNTNEIDTSGTLINALQNALQYTGHDVIKAF